MNIVMKRSEHSSNDRIEVIQKEKEEVEIKINNTNHWISRGKLFYCRFNAERMAVDPHLEAIRNSLQISIQSSDNETKKKKNIRTGYVCNDNMVYLSNKFYETEENLDQEKDHVHINEENKYENGINHKKQIIQVNITSSLHSIKDLFTTKPDELFLFVTPNIVTLSPKYMNILLKVLEPVPSLYDWEECNRTLYSVSNAIKYLFKTNVCIFDCGYFDGIKKIHRRDISTDSFQDQNICSSLYSGSSLPDISSLFLLASTVVSYINLEKKDENDTDENQKIGKDKNNVAIILAPFHKHINTLLAASLIYDNINKVNIDSSMATYFMRWYRTHVEEANVGFISKLQKHLSTLESPIIVNHPLSNKIPSILQISPTKKSRRQRNNANFNLITVSKSETRLIHNFRSLLIQRNQHFKTMIKATIEKQDKKDLKHNLVENFEIMAGMTILPILLNPIFIHSITINKCQLIDESLNFRPYFILQKVNGPVLFSNMVHGIHTIFFSKEPQNIIIKKYFGKSNNSENDIILKIYDVPAGMKGNLLFQYRFNLAVLENQLTKSRHRTGSIPIRCSEVDLLPLAESILPRDFSLHINFGCTETDFALENPTSNEPTIIETSSKELYNKNNASKETNPIESQNLDHLNKNPIDEDLQTLGEMFPDISLHQLRTILDDCTIDHTLENRMEAAIEEILLLDNENNIESSNIENNDNINEQLNERNDNLQCSFEECDPIYIETTDGRAKLINVQIIPRDNMDFYHRNNINYFSTNYICEFQFGRIQLTDNEIYFDNLPRNVQEKIEYLRNNYKSQHSHNENNENRENNRISPFGMAYRNNKKRQGNTNSAAISRLPTYIYNQQVKNDATSICLICRFQYKQDEILRTLPCFHSYHVDCIDPWLETNSICPICQIEIDQ